jgi:membrane-associated protein
MEYISYLFNSTLILQSLGLAGLLAIIFAESGLFFGFFLPGDSLLFTAGFLASQGAFPFGILCVGAILAAILGDNVGYAFGKKVGPRIFRKEESLFFSKKHIIRSELFFKNHGPKSLILARFIPAVRTFTPILAGVGSMDYKTFMAYNSIGGVIWGGGLTFLGYFLGNTVPHIDKYIYPIIALIVLASVIPPLLSLYKSKKNATK